MGNCKDCKYWVPQNITGVCIQISDGDDNRAYIAGVYYDLVELVTGPDFGCALFEQKESE